MDTHRIIYAKDTDYLRTHKGSDEYGEMVEIELEKILSQQHRCLDIRRGQKFFLDKNYHVIERSGTNLLHRKITQKYRVHYKNLRKCKSVVKKHWLAKNVLVSELADSTIEVDLLYYFEGAYHFIEVKCANNRNTRKKSKVQASKYQKLFKENPTIFPLSKIFRVYTCFYNDKDNPHFQLIRNY